MTMLLPAGHRAVSAALADDADTPVYAAGRSIEGNYILKFILFFIIRFLDT